MIPKLDKIDYNILSNIQNNAKITNLQLSETIGLSPASTLERVKRLEMQGVIKSYHAQLDRYKLAVHFNLWLQICLHNLSQETIKNFKQAIDQLPEVIACYQVIGDVDFLLSILTTDMVAYQNILVNKLSEISSIKSIKTMTVLSTIKETGIPIIPLAHY